MTPILIALALTLAGAAPPSSSPPERIGRIDRAAPAFDTLVAPDASIEKLAEGFTWAEGPVWIREGGYLLFTDVPGNRIHRWSAADGLSTFLEPSGHPGPDFAGFREPGANGLIRGPGNTILLADHGNRAIASLDLATRQKTFLATRYQGRRFSSPNDLVRASNGTIYFTDPPYGLEGLNDSPLKEQPHNGVYRLDPDGSVTLIDAEMTFPNGIILSPDERTLYVANSDPQRAIWVAYTLDAQGGVSDRRIFADVTAEVGEARPGLPDGTAIANCTFGGEDGSVLYLASHNMLARVPTRTRGLGF